MKSIEEQIKQKEAKLEEDMTLAKKVEWLLFEDGSSSDMKRYNECRNFFQEMGLLVGGYYPFSEQRAIEIMLYKGVQDNLDKTFEAISLVLPFIKPINDKGERRFKLFEHTLSEWGIYDLRFDKVGTWTLNKTTYGRKNVEETFENLYDALKYCQKHHYYESSEEE